MAVVAVLGAGKLGGTLARRAVAAGHVVRVAGRTDTAASRERLAAAVPGVQAGSVADAVDGADLVVLAVPLARYGELDPALLAGHVVVDAMNDWPPAGTTGIGAADAEDSSVRVQRHLPGSMLVKALNHIGYHDLEDEPLDGSSPRRALALATDHAGAARRVADFITSLGFDPVDAGDLDRGAAFARGTAAFAARTDAAGLRRLLASGRSSRVHELVAA